MPEHPKAMSIEAFRAYVIERLRRSNVQVDATYIIRYDKDYRNKDIKQIVVAPATADILFYVQGDEDAFWVFRRDDLWPEPGVPNPRRLAVTTIESRTQRYYHIDKDSVANDAYTPIPPGYYTSYESDVWLAERAQQTERAEVTA